MLLITCLRWTKIHNVRKIHNNKALSICGREEGSKHTKKFLYHKEVIKLPYDINKQHFAFDKKPIVGHEHDQHELR